MGMFDSALLDVDGVEKEFQFKIYIGKYDPQLRCVRLGEKLHDFPPIPYIEVEGYGDYNDRCVLQFTKGVLTGIIRPVPEDYQWAQLPPPKLWKQVRREAIARYAREARALIREHEGASWSRLGEVMTEQLNQAISRKGFASRFLSVRSKSGNYRVKDGKWVRARPY